MNNKASVNFIIKTVISLTCFLGILICIICNLSVKGKLTWSLYPITSILFLWLIIIPLFQFKRNKVRKALVSLSIFIIPFLLILNHIIGGTKLMLPIGIPISLIGIFYMWMIYFLFLTMKTGKWITVSVSIMLGIPVGIIVSAMISKFINHPIIDTWDILSYGIMIMISIITFFIGRTRKHLCLENGG
ncbi:hypothetical protein [Bacillus sp. S/N-304-OC-R1]|uniref:hypothetical protein n=1 Tax=Bacillus sp. S/N-304-OC-R1 TaxID=2758034 RepID=UPI001C8E5D59|nr:hypothetical protein [Bacillus sp. S/N-304-OC-R1]MBY0123781.1 hypothetical protein [Bacillus sp. S/N-304-OC-R1]